MRAVGVAVFLALMCGGGLRVSAQNPPPRFALAIPDVSPFAMGGGGVVRIPIAKVGRLEMSIGAPASRRIDPGSISVELNQVRLEPITTTGAVMTVTVNLAAGDWKVDAPNRLSVSVRGTRDYANEWLIEKGTGLAMVETVGDDQGVPVEITLRQPRLPVIAPASGTMPLVIQGAVNRAAAVLTVNGQPVAPTTSSDGMSGEFRVPLTVTREVAEVVIEARGKADDYSRVIFPIRWPAR
jgi:type 1 fimbria pilin